MTTLFRIAAHWQAPSSLGDRPQPPIPECQNGGGDDEQHSTTLCDLERE